MEGRYLLKFVGATPQEECSADPAGVTPFLMSIGMPPLERPLRTPPREGDHMGGGGSADPVGIANLPIAIGATPLEGAPAGPSCMTNLLISIGKTPLAGRD